MMVFRGLGVANKKARLSSNARETARSLLRPRLLCSAMQGTACRTLCRYGYFHGLFSSIVTKGEIGSCGIFPIASNTAKRCVEVLHRLGLSVTYETVVSAPRRNGKASPKQLRKEIRHRRFFVSFDNMNFFRNVRDQRMHNHAHQVNYPRGLSV